METNEKKIEETLLKIKFKENVVCSQEDVERSFNKIKERLEVQLKKEDAPVMRIPLYATQQFKVACSIALLLTMSFFGYRYFEQQKEIVIANSTGLVKEILLPDGSKVSLRQESSIAYKGDFDENRKIELKGEALFAVTKDKKHPFSVNTKLGKITVLGSTFSVRAFPNETYTKALLKEGSVKFEANQNQASVILKPGEEAKLNEGIAKIELRKVENMDRALAWQSHNFSFDNETLAVIVSVISEAFDKKIEIKDQKLAIERFSMKFNRNESLPRILDVLSDVAKFKYREEKDKIIIEN